MRYFDKRRALSEQACDTADALHVAWCEAMAVAYHGGQGVLWANTMLSIVPDDAAKSTALYAKLLAARAASCQRSGDAKSCFAAGQQYERGLGVAADEANAGAMFALACKQKHPAGCSPAEAVADACERGDVDSCDKACAGGNDGACDHASDAVKAATAPRVAKAKLPGLFASCAADKSEFEKWRVAAVAANRKKDSKAADEAHAKLQEIEPRWHATRDAIQKAISLAGVTGAEFVKFMSETEEQMHLRPRPHEARVVRPHGSVTGTHRAMISDTTSVGSRVVVVSAFLLAVALPSCADKAQPSLNVCVVAEAKGILAEAVAACQQATSLDPGSKAGKAAAEKIPDLKAKLAANEKATEDCKNGDTGACSVACDSGDLTACLKLGMSDLASDDDSVQAKAETPLTKACNGGSGRACYELGRKLTGSVVPLSARARG